MDESRRHAEAWAQEWRLRKRNKTLITVIAVVVLLVAAISLMSYFSNRVGRMTFSSEEEMKAAVQGRYALDTSYTDLVIEGDKVTNTYWSYSHYNRDYAERYGYDAEQDSVHTDYIVKWDYKHGVLKTEWMGDLIIDKDGNIHKGKYTVLYKTDRPRPDPIDPATLSNPDGDPNAIIPEDMANEIDERNDSIEEANEAAAAVEAAKTEAVDTESETTDAADTEQE